MFSNTHSRRWFYPALLATALILAGCAPRSYLIVDYQLPRSDYKLDGSRVRMQIEDQRKSRQLLTPEAAAEFEAFNDRYNLAWIQPDKTRQRAGNFDLEEMFSETFRKRLEMLGVHVMRSSLSSAPLFRVEIIETQIDLKDRNWSAQMSCRVTLEGDGGRSAHQEVIGTAQRPKILGRKGADTVLSEIFSDVINRIDIERLFEQAGL
jgi:hypothetical protein